MKQIALALALIALASGTGAIARDRLGVWNDWGAFRDAAVPRCYAIAMASDTPARGHQTQPFFTVATWPRRAIHGEVHVRLSRNATPGKPVDIVLGGRKFALVSSGIDAWAADRRMDAAIIAAMRESGDMTVAMRGRDGHLSRDTYHLVGAASAMDAASLGCAGS
ncbi:hypothetical protein [Novosphingobium sp.]|uniref:hypothetical protein n=1 Tax=Novosphingobium sp. TaxID=1874826 RepID=UPI003D0F211A